MQLIKVPFIINKSAAGRKPFCGMWPEAFKPHSICRNSVCLPWGLHSAVAVRTIVAVAMKALSLLSRDAGLLILSDFSGAPAND
jgi:hypothetical protein